MFLTVAEAETKVCPHITYDWVETNGMSGNQITRTAHANCCSLSCMSWRWAGGLPSTEKGYCGLAGRPGIIQKDPE